MHYQHWQYNLNLWCNLVTHPTGWRPAELQWSQDRATSMIYLNAALVIVVLFLLSQTSCLPATRVNVIDVGFNGWKPMEAWHRNIQPMPDNSWKSPSREGRRRQWYRKLCNASRKRCKQEELEDNAAGTWRRSRRRSIGKRRPMRRREELRGLRSQKEGRSALGEDVVLLDEVSPPILSRQEVQHMKYFILEKIETLKQQSLPPFQKSFEITPSLL